MGEGTLGRVWGIPSGILSSPPQWGHDTVEIEERQGSSRQCLYLQQASLSMEPPREQLATSGKTVLLLLAPTAGTAVSSNPLALPTMPNQGGQLLPRLSQGLLWLWGSAGYCSVWQWRWTCRECRILGESRTTPHPGLTLGLPGERAGTGFPTERENLIQRAVVLKFFHHSSPLKCWRGYVRKHQLEVWRGRRVRSLWEKSLVEHWPIPKIRKQLHHFGWTKPTQCIWKREVRVMPCWD